jgi:hypothetical protein
MYLSLALLPEKFDVLLITKNCDDSVGYLLKDVPIDSFLCIWIDAICIGQKNSVERNL